MFQLISRFSSILMMVILCHRPLLGARAASTAGDKPAEEVVFLLHGICKSKLDMAPLTKALREEGYEAVNWEYPSRNYTIEEIADLLHEELKGYQDRKVHFVTHSMGGIVVRKYLSKYSPENCGRFVMIAPPNQGALLANFFGDWGLYKAIFGPAGQQLKEGDAGVCTTAGVPECEFAIIAGGSGKKVGMNPLIPGDNDGTISVDSTRLDGAKDFLLLPYHHPYIQMMPRTYHSVSHFLRDGHFCPSEKDKEKHEQMNEADRKAIEAADAMAAERETETITANN